MDQGRPGQSGSLPAGIMLAVGANLMWGLAFLVPVLLPQFSPATVTLGRYLCYGLLSVGIVLITRPRLYRHAWPVWRACLLFAITGNVGYYFFLTQGIALVGAPVTAVVIGLIPVTVALYGNRLRTEFPFRVLLIPVILITIGLIAVNIAEIDWTGLGHRSVGAQLVGVGAAVISLAMWTWFGVANAQFLHAHPTISSSQWSTMIGIATLGLSLLAIPLLLLVSNDFTRVAQSQSSALWWLVAGSLVLGVLVSWAATVLWNRASTKLPISVAGQLIVLETVFGLLYVFIAIGRVPSPLALVGIAIVLLGVLVGIRRTKIFQPEHP